MAGDIIVSTIALLNKCGYHVINDYAIIVMHT